MGEGDQIGSGASRQLLFEQLMVGHGPRHAWLMNVDGSRKVTRERSLVLCFVLDVLFQQVIYSPDRSRSKGYEPGLAPWSQTQCTVLCLIRFQGIRSR